jgi:alpha-ketoglutarate-dependent taurine dioxygenase
MEIVPLGPGFAAELRGVTIHDVAASEGAYAAVRAAFEEHSVLVLRDQDVTDEAQLAFSSRFGPLEVTKPTGVTAAGCVAGEAGAACAAHSEAGARSSAHISNGMSHWPFREAGRHDRLRQ